MQLWHELLEENFANILHGQYMSRTLNSATTSFFF